MDTTFVDREQPRLLQELFDFLSIPSVSTLPAHSADTRRAAEWLRTELTRLGCPVVDLIEGDGHPVVWAEGPVVPGRPTLLIYGHYDVQPPDPIEEWDSPAVLADGARRKGVRPRRGGRQGPGVLSAQGLRGGAGRERPAAAQRPVRLRGRRGVRRTGGLRSASRRARADPGGRRAGLRQLLLRARLAGGLHRPPRALLRRDLGPDAAARSPLRLVRWGGSQRAGDAGSHAEPAQERRRRDPDSQAVQVGRGALPEGAEGLAKAALRRGGLPPRRGDRQGAHRPGGSLGVRAHLGAADLRDPRHPRRLRGRRRQDGHPRARGGEGQPPAGSRANATRRWPGSSSAPWPIWRPSGPT